MKTIKYTFKWFEDGDYKYQEFETGYSDFLKNLIKFEKIPELHLVIGGSIIPFKNYLDVRYFYLGFDTCFDNYEN